MRLLKYLLPILALPFLSSLSCEKKPRQNLPTTCHRNLKSMWFFPKEVGGFTKIR